MSKKRTFTKLEDFVSDMNPLQSCVSYGVGRVGGGGGGVGTWR